MFSSDNNNNISDDLESVFNATAPYWEEIRGKKIFFTGATGFFGIWLLESFLRACNNLDLNSEALVLSRNPEKFLQQQPHLAACRRIKFHKGDVRNFEFPLGEYTHILHGATTSATETFEKQDPLVKFDTVAVGTKHVLDFAVHSGCEKFLFISSASAYGKQPNNILQINESYNGAPLTIDKNFDHSVLGEAKRVSELLTIIYSDKYNFETKIARCYSFVGPYIPLNIHYVIGNVIRDAINGGPIRLSGDGTTERSYLYISDLSTWLWTILFKGKDCEIYNVGSEVNINTKKLAEIVAESFKNEIEIIVEKSPGKIKNIDRYIPSTKKARDSLGLQETINLSTAIEKTLCHITANESLYNLNSR